MSDLIKTRREILFIYDVKDGNPNGDPLDSNKPRIDEETGINIVTDVRLKRTVRDFLFNYKGYNGENGKNIFVRTTHDDKGFIKDGKGRALDFYDKNEKDKKKAKQEAIEKILKTCIDIRLFGAVIPLEGDSITFTGPVQFKMGRSLNKVELKRIKGTGAFASKTGAKQQTFRDEYVVPYSIIVFYGIINENAAKHTGLSDDDVNELKEALWNGTKNLLSRSKMLHTPRLLLEIEHLKPGVFIGELDKFVKLKSDLIDEKIRDITDFELDFKALKEQSTKHNTKINVIKKDDRVKVINLS